MIVRSVFAVVLAIPELAECGNGIMDLSFKGSTEQ
jgi:hypothetical protein